MSFAAEDLATKFGEPPTEMFVDELWPVLRDRWLATRPASRNRVVAELRKSGLGDTAIKISTKTGQMEYLRSCRQSGRLKAIVLAAFLDEGSQPMMAPSVMVESPSDGQPPEPAAKDTQGVPGQDAVPRLHPRPNGAGQAGRGAEPRHCDHDRAYGKPSLIRQRR